MPVMKIYYDAELADSMAAHCEQIVLSIRSMMCNCLAAAPDKTQVILVQATAMSPMPVYVDLQFRANDHRSRDVVAAAMQETAELLTSCLGCGVRIRSFDIVEAALHALDVNGRGPA